MSDRTELFVDRNTIRFSRIVPVDRGTLWNAISRKEGLDQWFMITEIDRQVGGKFSFKNGWGGVVGEFNHLNTIQFNNEGGGITRFEINETGEDVQFTLIDTLSTELVSPFLGSDYGDQPGGPGTHWAGVVAGWHCFVNDLLYHLNDSSTRSSEEEYVRLSKHYETVIKEYHSAEKE